MVNKAYLKYVYLLKKKKEDNYVQWCYRSLLFGSVQVDGVSQILFPSLEEVDS